MKKTTALHGAAKSARRRRELLDEARQAIQERHPHAVTTTVVLLDRAARA